MSRSPRFLPKNQDGVLVEVSSRTVNAWALLRPSAELSDVTVGVLGRSLEISPVEIVAISCLSNHHHMLLLCGAYSYVELAEHRAGIPRKEGQIELRHST